MSKFTNYLIAAAIVLALVGCKKDGGSSASLPSSYSTDNGTLKVTVNDWDLDSYKNAQVTLSETGEGITIGIYNALACYPEVLVTGCTYENGVYSGEKVLLEGLRSISIKATIDTAKMLLNIFDNHTGSYIGKEWMLAGTGKVETVKNIVNKYTICWDDSTGRTKIDSVVTVYAYDTVTCEMPAINFSSTMNFKVPNYGYDAQFRIRDTSKSYYSSDSDWLMPKDSVEFSKLCELIQEQLRLGSFYTGVEYSWTGASGSISTSYLENPELWSPTLTQYRKDQTKLPRYVNNGSFWDKSTTYDIASVCAVIANFEYFELSKYGRAGVVVTDFEHCRAKDYLRWWNYEGQTTSSKGDGIKDIHNLVYNSTNPLTNQPLLSVVDPYSQYNVLQFGEGKAQHSDAILLELCTGALGERVIELINFALKDILYSSKKIEFDHLDIPLQLVSYSDSRLKIGFDQDFIRGIVEQLYNDVKDMTWEQFSTEVLPGYKKFNDLMKENSKEKDRINKENFQKVKDYISSAYKYLVTNKCTFELSIELEPYDAAKVMPWEAYMIDKMQKQAKQ